MSVSSIVVLSVVVSILVFSLLGVLIWVLIKNRRDNLHQGYKQTYYKNKGKLNKVKISKYFDINGLIMDLGNAENIISISAEDENRIIIEFLVLKKLKIEKIRQNKFINGLFLENTTITLVVSKLAKELEQEMIYRCNLKTKS